MAKNQKYERAVKLNLPVASGVVSGQAVIVGTLPGVALTDRRTDGTASVHCEGAYDLPCEAVDATPSSSPIAIGDRIYYDAAATVKLNKDATNGVPFGWALTALAGGATGTVTVKIGGR